MEDIKTEYKGYVIKYTECFDNTEEWTAFLDSTCAYSNQSLVAVKKWIDRKEKVKFDRFQAYLRDYDRGYKLVTITSIDENGIDAWYSDGESRGKSGLRYLIENTPANVTLINQIQKITGDIKTLQEQESLLRGQLTTLAAKGDK